MLLESHVVPITAHTAMKRQAVCPIVRIVAVIRTAQYWHYTLLKSAVESRPALTIMRSRAEDCLVINRACVDQGHHTWLLTLRVEDPLKQSMKITEGTNEKQDPADDRRS